MSVPSGRLVRRDRRPTRLDVYLPRRPHGGTLRACTRALRVRTVPERWTLHRRQRLVGLRVHARMDRRHVCHARPGLHSRVSRVGYLRVGSSALRLSSSPATRSAPMFRTWV